MMVATSLTEAADQKAQRAPPLSIGQWTPG